MKIVQINTFSNGSTGKIMLSIHNKLLDEKYNSFAVWGRGRKSKNNNELLIANKKSIYYHVFYSRITGKTGFASKKNTIKLLKHLDEIKPDIVHMHNVHGYYLNIELLFNYLKEKKIKTIWTLHDCWPFTGQCAYFTLENCSKWRNHCYRCPMIHEYPKTMRDSSSWNYKKKKEIFTGLDITLVTPSKWLANLVKESFLKDYPLTIINNGIDTSVFKPTKSEFRKKYKLENKIIILGVAGVWDRRKGLNDFIKLSEVLNDDYKIVLVGLNKKQIKNLPSSIIGISRTENQQELAGLYSTANIFLNTTYEDNYPTVNLEALACGTPVLSYDTGGSIEFEEFIKHNKVRYVIKKAIVSQDINNLKKRIDEIINTPLEITDIKKMDEKTMVNNYIYLYNEIMKN